MTSKAKKNVKVAGVSLGIQSVLSMAAWIIWKSVTVSIMASENSADIKILKPKVQKQEVEYSRLETRQEMMLDILKEIKVEISSK